MACSLEAVSIGKLESLLECSICLETVKDPRTLPCFHSYCMYCLERFVKNHRENEVGRQVKDFNCPNCRRQFTLNPGEEVADMTPNHFICNMLEVMAVQDRVKGVPCSHCQKPSVGRCVDCEVFLCQECLTDHNKYRGFVNHSVLSMDELAKPENQRKIRRKLHCQEHEKTLKFYCETCQKLICRDCTDFNHEKPDHSWLPVAKAADKEKQHLASSCATFTQQLQEGTQLLETVSNLTQSLDRNAKTVKSEINQKRQDMLNTFSQILDKNTRSLLSEVDKIHSIKQSELEAQTGEVRSYVDNVKRSVQLSTNLLEKGNDEEILSSQNMIQDNAENLKKERPRNMIPVNDDKICYRWHRVDVKRFAEIANNLGRVEDGIVGKKYEKILEQSSPGDSKEVETVQHSVGQIKLHVEPSSIDVAQFIQQVYREDLETFKSQNRVDVVLSEDKRLTLKPMRGFKQSEFDEVARKLQQFYEITSKNLTRATLDLREFSADDAEKIKKSMSRHRGGSDIMMEESSSDVFTLIGNAENVEMFRRNALGALQRDTPASENKGTIPTDPMVASRKGTRVILMLGEIQKQECDAIVNFTDKDLVHKTGLPCDIREAAGEEFWKVCRDRIARNGSLITNMVTLTSAGSLPCQIVIHAILPEISEERRQEVLRLSLKETCHNALKIANENRVKSICFPVVTPDIANLSPAKSARLLFEVIKEFMEAMSPLDNNSIEEIRIVYRKTSRCVEQYMKEFTKQF